MCILAAAGILLLCSLYYGSLVKQFAGKMSVKYQGGGLSGIQIDKLYEQTESKEIPYITGWDRNQGRKAENKELGNETMVTLLEVYGDMPEVLPQPLLFGSYVEKEDKKGCVISLKTAEELFHSNRIIGCEVSFQNKQYQIRGVIQTDENILMVQAEKENSLPYLELCYGRGNYAASNTKAFLNGQGLPAYDSFTEGNFYAGMAGIFMGLPFLLLLILCCKGACQRIQREERPVFRCVEFGFLFAATLIFLAIIGKYSISFSDDFIPTRVSDFAFWSNKYSEVRRDYKLMLQYRTWYQESIILGNLRNCFVTSMISAILLIAAKMTGNSQKERNR